MNVAVKSKTRVLTGGLDVIRKAGNIEILIVDPAKPHDVALLNIKLSETQALSFGLALTEIALGKL